MAGRHAVQKDAKRPPGLGGGGDDAAERPDIHHRRLAGRDDEIAFADGILEQGRGGAGAVDEHEIEGLSRRLDVEGGAVVLRLDERDARVGAQGGPARQRLLRVEVEDCHLPARLGPARGQVGEQRRLAGAPFCCAKVITWPIYSVSGLRCPIIWKSTFRDRRQSQLHPAAKGRYALA